MKLTKTSSLIVSIISIITLLLSASTALGQLPKPAFSAMSYNNTPYLYGQIPTGNNYFQDLWMSYSGMYIYSTTYSPNNCIWTAYYRSSNGLTFIGSTSNPFWYIDARSAYAYNGIYLECYDMGNFKTYAIELTWKRPGPYGYNHYGLTPIIPSMPQWPMETFIY